jgi:hypothetical protein
MDGWMGCGQYVPAAGVSLKTIGNSAEGGEYCGMLDHVVIRPYAAVLQADDLLPHLHLGTPIPVPVPIRI